MSRTCATALALVNWKGVFYERYLLDRHVTALEGANGAGKTTVMIAAYVVLLPDLVRLRFTNLGETAATGGDRGLYGRLGEPGRPSYAAIELELGDGTRVVAGVMLVRRTEPTLELTPFLVSGVDLAGSMKEIFLLSTPDADQIPELDDVRAAVTKRGGRIQVFASAKDYFAALFERGITPLRLATDEERTKLHDMLRTSMTGGISRALTTELRSFLLKEESGLAETLGLMRANLDACRRTRAEVADARALEHDITGVHAAGVAMFRSRVAAARTELEEARTARETADARVATAATETARLDAELRAAEEEAVRVGSQLEASMARTREQTTKRAAAAKAQAIADRLSGAGAALAEAQRREEATRMQRESARERREAARAVRGRAQDAHERAARGLGDLQAGLEELHRRAHAKRQAQSALAEASQLLGAPVDPAAIGPLLTTTRAELARVDAERARTARDAALEDVHRRERAKAEAALAIIIGSAASPESPHDAAREALALLSERARVAARREGLERELAGAEARAAQALDVRRRAEIAGVRLADDDDTQGAIARAQADADDALARADTAMRQAEDGIAAAVRAGDDAAAEALALEGLVARWEALAPGRARVEARVETPIRTTEDMLRARDTLSMDRDRSRAEVARFEQDVRVRERNAEHLERGAGLPTELLAVREVLGAELLIARFEDTPVEDAAWIEAALGPLAHALVVSDPGLAAETLSGLSGAPETVWLLAEEDVPALLAEARALVGSAEAVDVVVRERVAIRVSRKPEVPVVGRDARMVRAAAYRTEMEALRTRITEALEAARATDALVRDAERLLLEAPLVGDDPTRRLEAARLRIATTHAAASAASARAGAIELEALRAQTAALRALASEARALPSGLTEAQLREERARVEEARRAEEELLRVGTARRDLELYVDALRGPHGVPAGLDAEATARERDRVFAAVSALEQLAANVVALAYPDADTAGDASALRATLEAQHADARATASRADEALHAAEYAWDDANAAWQATDAERRSLEAAHAQLSAELAAAGGDAVLGLNVAVLDAELASLAGATDALRERERVLATSAAVTRERLVRVATELTSAHDASGRAQHMCLRVETAYAAFATLAEAAGARETSAPSVLTQAEHLAEARAKRDVLVARLDQVRGGADGAAAVRNSFANVVDEAPSAYLEGWLATRAWALRRLPAQLADVADPADGIARLRADLDGLASDVARQESDLRGGSEDVARGIDLQLRKTAARIRRLNRDLEQVAFGSVGAVRVLVKRVERMDLVLRALRTGGVQELLFQSSLPLEDALAEVFKRYGGGGKGGAGKVLDYREYVELGVEIQRRGSTDWETASPTRLSTGEAIGVGAALMMVILTEWERDANLLRSDRPTGTLRFLFLDEANRLSPDNLVVLFDLCRMLDLQLLVAAPEVAHAHGNTTYRLVRHVDPVGREEVLVSGRRAAPA